VSGAGLNGQAGTTAVAGHGTPGHGIAQLAADSAPVPRWIRADYGAVRSDPSSAHERGLRAGFTSSPDVTLQEVT
jgi:hypothetical protein